MSVSITKLSPTEIDLALKEHALDAWASNNAAITRTLTTRDWRATMMVANGIAYVCETAWHHPQLTLSYAQIVIRLDTHDVGGVSMRDIELAKQIDTWLAWNGAGEGAALDGLPPGKAMLKS
jgi:4a-hydroxytetrahydrobiopterin dehydratase